MPFGKKSVIERSMVCMRRVFFAYGCAIAVGWAAVAIAGSAEDLNAAAVRGDLAAVQKLVARGADVNTKTLDGSISELNLSADADIQALLESAGAKREDTEREGKAVPVSTCGPPEVMAERLITEATALGWQVVKGERGYEP